MRIFEMQSTHIQIGGVMAMLLLLAACASDSVPPPVVSAQPDWLPAVADFKSEPNAAEPSDPLLRILWKYAPDSFYVIDRAENLPPVVKFGATSWTLKRSDEAVKTVYNPDGSKTTSSISMPGFRKWIRETDPLKQVNELVTATHENKHRYTADFAVPLMAEASGGNILRLRSNEYSDHRATLYYSYYLSRERTRLNRLYPTFPAREIADYIPQANRTDRYEIYVADDGPAQDIGIFSMLDEYNASYWSERTMYDLYQYYQAEQPPTAVTWQTYCNGQSGFFGGWAEFRYFFLTYLLYAKDKHPDVYQKLLADDRFRQTFTEVDDQYIDMHKRVIERLTSELPAYLQSKGIKSRISTYIDPKTNKFSDYIIYIDNYGTGLYWERYQATSLLLRAPTYLAIANEFRTTPAPELPPMEISRPN